MTTSELARRGWPLLILAALVAVAFGSGLGHALTLETLKRHRETLQAMVAAHGALTGLAFVGFYVAVVALSLPGAAVMTLTGGFLFGPWLGALLSLVGATIGATILFLIARSVAGDLLRRRAGPFLQRMADGFHRDAFHYLLFLRLVPAFPFWVVNLVPALVAMPLRPFVVATALGIIPASLVFATLGAGLGQVFQAGGTVSLHSVFSPATLAGLAGLGLLALIPVAVRRLRTGSNREDSVTPNP
jgi:uncharacterized membrane protein YdjX (TVP38/TMEM64 family)